MIRFDIITLFPEVYSYINFGIIKRASEKNLIDIKIHNLRKYGIGKRKKVDDKPFGGGPGMLLMIEPIYKCLKDIKAYPKTDNFTRIILTSPSGKILNQKKAKNLSKMNRVVIISGRYEGIDARVSKYFCDEELSVGKYVLSGGELPSMIILDSVSRMVPGVLGNYESLIEESFSSFNVEYPQYTRPAKFKTEEGDILSVPDILLSGNHKKIKNWKHSFSS